MIDEFEILKKDFKRIIVFPEYEILRKRAIFLFREIEEEREKRKIWKVSEEIKRMNRVLAKRGVTKREADRRWENWLKHCEVNNLDEWTGIPKKEENWNGK